jgi:hypothetical protein
MVHLGLERSLGALRLTAARSPFETADAYSLSVAECLQLAPFITGVAFRFGCSSDQLLRAAGGSTLSFAQPCQNLDIEPLWHLQGTAQVASLSHRVVGRHDGSNGFAHHHVVALRARGR